MTVDISAAPEAEVVLPETREKTTRKIRLRLPIPVIAALLYLSLVLLAILAPELLGATDPTATSPATALHAPGEGFLLGSDQLGRDIYSRILHGARWSIGIAVAALAIGVFLGAVLGLIAGLSNRIVNEITGRLFDLLSAFPGVLLALLIAVLWGRGVTGIALAIGLSSVPKFGRIIRARTLQVSNSDYVVNAVTFGHSKLRNIVRHVLPNVIGSIGLVAAMDLGASILAVSGLSFLKMGPQPPTPEWGIMLAESRDVLRVAWWASVFPGLALVLTVASFVVLGRYAQARFERRVR
ncbi:ABC transporter permease [Nocardia higoensis]|uniref:ABC transporter permease n=1 Tax=Nocardia higoensis TaxID=228599 RepID=UPI0002FE0ADF|nr:ABC transporter permease [Nocardia higoensis]